MDNQQQVALLKQGRERWNAWRMQHPEIRPNLINADFREINLAGANLYKADLRETDLRYADLRGANLRFADLRGADLSGADLSEADLHGALLGSADLSFAKTSGARLDPPRAVTIQTSGTHLNVPARSASPRHTYSNGQRRPNQREKQKRIGLLVCSWFFSVCLLFLCILLLLSDITWIASICLIFGIFGLNFALTGTILYAENNKR
jgi:hypothetical protein